MIHDISFDINENEILGVVGESGSGKSTVGNAIINLIDEPGKVSSGSVLLGELNIHEDPKNIVKYRGKKIGLIFQDPQTSLNPILTIGEQLIETIQTHLDLTKEEAKEFKREQYKKFPVGGILNPKEWQWGEVNEEATLTLASDGATVHFVDEGVDTGQIINQVSVQVHKGDTQAQLHERIKIEERKILVQTIRELVERDEEPV